MKRSSRQEQEAVGRKAGSLVRLEVRHEFQAMANGGFNLEVQLMQNGER